VLQQGQPDRQRIQPAPGERQPYRRPRHHARRRSERVEGEQLTVHDPGDHHRRHSDACRHGDRRIGGKTLVSA